MNFKSNRISLFYLLVILGATWSLNSYCQEDTTSVVSKDTLISMEEAPQLIDSLFKERNHSPRAAIIASAIIPGLGQAYNKKYWKIPIIYGAGIGIYYFYDINNTYYQRLKTAFTQKKNDQDVTDPDLMNLDITGLESRRNTFRRYRDYNVIFFGLLYVANIVDALVDAYMFRYDISRDLTMQIGPAILPPDPINYSATCGLKVKFSF